ncbi:hypothetical protein BCON_0058g00150 [Botryotinia convoluta]|uniref:RRM domain-containing protein n=1 Tax=Botryotinia convoluta TaxID=54673 RepID=A0A4Z1IN16_9HELO|nr:hypothetical protein BCON_0058g00150 [Botryotinia convoluta]
MSSLNFTSSFPRNQNNQNGSFWNPTSPVTTAHHRRQSEYLSRSMANALGTVPLPNFNYDKRKPRRITSPLSNVKPIGFERTNSRQMGYSHFSISEVGEDVPSFEEEESGDNSPIITKSLVGGLQPTQHRASSSKQEDEMSVLDLETSVAGLNINEQSSPSKGKKLYGTLQGYIPYAHAREHTEGIGMQSSTTANRDRDITAIFRGPQVQSSLHLSSGTTYAPPSQSQPLGHRAVGYQHNRSMTSYGGPGQYMSQFNAQVVGTPSNVDGGYTRNSQMPRNSFVHQQGNEQTLPPPAFHQWLARLYTTDLTHYFQPGLRQTDQLLREQGLLAPLPASTPAASHYLGDNEDRDFPSKFGGEVNLPNELNCAVWIQGIPKDFSRHFLYQELFNAVSIGPIIAAYICLGGDQHSHHAAKVLFKHPEHAARLFQRAFFRGIYINGNRIRVEPNRHGHRQYPLRLHYRSRVVLVEVFNNPSMDLGFWKIFISNLCVYDIENCRHLSYSTPARMVMEFRFARIFGQASVLLAGIRSTASFEGIVTASLVFAETVW